MCRIVSVVAAVLFTSSLAFAQAQLPSRVDAIVQQLYQANRALAEGNDNQRRQLTRMIAEQVTCELGPTWGWKSASPDRPPSKDAIARHGGNPFAGPLDGWDLFDGNTRRPIPGGIYHDLTRPSRQHFIAVAHIDHLNIGCNSPIPPPPPPPPPQPPPVEPPPPPPPAPPPPSGDELKRIDANVAEILRILKAAAARLGIQ